MMSVQELLQHVHPDAVYHRTPLADDQNALGLWREAMKHYVPPDDGDSLWNDLLFAEAEQGEAVAFPNDDAGKRLRVLLERSQETLNLIEAGVHRGRFQLPMLPCGEQYENDLLDFAATIIEPFRQLLVVQSKALLADGDVAGAGHVLIHLFRMGEMVCNGEGLLVDYILANGCRNTAMRAIRDLANRNDTPNTVLRECLTALEANQGREVGLAKRLQIKLSYDLAKIDALPDGGELEPLVDRLLEVHYQSEILTIMPAETPEWIVPTDDRLAWRRRQILSLLQGHPCPFDKIATVRWLGDRVADAIHDLSEEGPQQEQSSSGAAPRRRSHHRRAFRQWPRRMKHWPDHLAPGFLIGLLGPSEAAAKERAKMEEVMAAAQLASLAPPTEADIAVCREELRRVKNPVGLIVARNLLSVDCCHFAAEHQATLAETIALLTQRLAG